MAKHKSHEKTRANRRKKYLHDDGRLDIRSIYGYLDPTPYFALKNEQNTKTTAQVKS